jgi:aconitate hydratase
LLPLPDAIVDAIENNKLVGVSVLSGNRNFEGRVHANVRANYLASPPLVVAYALAGTIRKDLTREPIGTGRDGQPVYLKDIWPTQKEVNDTVHAAVTRRMFQERYGEECTSRARRNGRPFALKRAAIPIAGIRAARPPVQNPAPYFEGMTADPKPVGDVKGARILAQLADSITTDHISPAGQYPQERRRRVSICWNYQVRQADSDGYGAGAATIR